MIPTLVLIGLAIGLLPRPWYAVGLLVAGCGWALHLIVVGTIPPTDGSSALGAFVLALANAAVGILAATAFVALRS
jgi:hypothetical protein